MTKLSRLSISMLVALGLVSSAQATLLLYDGFNGYTNGDLATQSQGTGWNGSWTDTGNTTDALTANSSTSLSYTDGSGNALSTQSGSAQDAGTAGGTLNYTRAVSSSVTNAFTDGATLWFSFLWKPESASERPILGFSHSTANSANGIWLYNSAADTIVAKIGATSSSSTFNATLNTTYFVVGKVQVSTAGNETLDLWFNPTMGGSSPTGGTQLTVSGDYSQIGTVGYFLASGSNQAQLYTFDELRLATTFDEVAPVPEPGVLGAILFGVGLLTINFSRRRNR